MSKYLLKTRQFWYNMKCLVFVLYWIIISQKRIQKSLHSVNYLHFEQCPNFFLNGVVFCIFPSWRIRLFLTLSPSFFQANILALTWSPRTLLLSPSYLVTSSRSDSDFSYWKCLLSSENIWFAVNTEYLTTLTCRWVQRKLTVCMRIWQTWIRFRLFSSTTLMITTWPTPRRQSWFSFRMP